jgi:RNase P/RNase MRP subunit POP5
MVRVKYRYIVCQIMFNDASNNASKRFEKGGGEIFAKDIQLAIRESIQEVYGDSGMGEFGDTTFVKFFDSENSHMAVIRTSRGSERNVMFCLSCVCKIKSSDLVFRTLSVNSCSRTCIKSLRRVVKLYVNNARRIVDDQKPLMIAAIDKLIIAADL